MTRKLLCSLALLAVIGLSSPVPARAASPALAADPLHTPICGQSYPVLTLQSEVPGAVELAWSAFPIGSGIDHSSLEYRLRVTDSTRPERTWNYALYDSLIPVPGAPPGTFDVDSGWTCGDIFEDAPLFTTQIGVPDSIRFGKKLGVRSSRGSVMTKIEIGGPESPTPGSKLLSATVDHFKYPRQPLAQLLAQDWNGEHRLYKVAPKTYDLHLRRIERQGSLTLTHTARVTLKISTLIP